MPESILIKQREAYFSFGNDYISGHVRHLLFTEAKTRDAVP
jgi:hypothetical protein